MLRTDVLIRLLLVEEACYLRDEIGQAIERHTGYQAGTNLSESDVSEGIEAHPPGRIPP